MPSTLVTTTVPVEHKYEIGDTIAWEVAGGRYDVVDLLIDPSTHAVTYMVKSHRTGKTFRVIAHRVEPSTRIAPRIVQVYTYTVEHEADAAYSQAIRDRINDFLAEGLNRMGNLMPIPGTARIVDTPETSTR